MTQEYLKSKLSYDKMSGIFKWLNSGKKAGTVNTNGYLVITIDGKKHKAHRLAFFYENGYMPKLIDHIDRNKLNNSIINLRDTTSSINQYNTSLQKNNSSGIKGVYFRKSKNKFIAQIKLDKKNIHLGYFDNIEEASKARKLAELKYL
jgi:hypothetical protein